jgi:Skp family chaperone for outer membrane proteins
MTFKFWGVLLPLALPIAAMAEGSVPLPAPVIGIIDVDEVQLQSLAAKAVRTQADKYRQEFQQQDATEEAALRASQQAIEQQHRAMTPEALADKKAQESLAEKARAFDTSYAEYQRRKLARVRAFEKSLNQAMSKIQQAMYEATGKAAGDHGANVILPRGQVVLFDDKMNLTKEIIAYMNAALPTVDFPVPQLEGAPPAQTPPVPPKKKN